MTARLADNPQAIDWQTIDIDRIVRDVLTQLETIGPRPAAREISAGTNGARRASKAPAKAPGAQVTLDERVITVSHLDARLKSVEQVIIPRGAVLTPAARDWLRQRNVRVSAAEPDANSASMRRVLIAAAQTKFDPSGIARTVAQQGVAVERVAQTGLASVVEELCEGVVKGGHRALLFTDQSAPASCLANRHRGVRAVVAAQPRPTAEAVASLGANFLIVEPTPRTTFEMNNLVRDFVRGEPRACPDTWRDQLG